MMHETAYAKINLSLQIVGKRDDGYHLLDSLVAFAGVGDHLSAEAHDRLSLEIIGPYAVGLATEQNNLVLRAARALQEQSRTSQGARLILEKNLPVASGIGGGSADAAACLRLLSRLWNIEIAQGALHAIAASLGADVPVCVGQQAARMQGVGEVLASVPPLPACGMVLANPGEAVSTQTVFRAMNGAYSGSMTMPDGWEGPESFAHWLHDQTNDLQDAAIRVCPAIGTTLEALENTPGCLIAKMSGSGATCFGLFSDAAQAEAAAANLRSPGWWVWGGPMLVNAF